MAEPTLSREDVRALGRWWWLPLVLGLLSVVAGVIVLIKPSNSLATLAVIAGIFILIDGIAELISSIIGTTENRGLVALLGALNFIVGILLIRHPIGGVTVIALFIGIWLVAIGAVRFVLAFEVEGHRVSRIVVAVIEVIAGIVIVAVPGIGYATLALLVGLAFIFNGAGLCALGIVMRSAGKAASA